MHSLKCQNESKYQFSSESINFRTSRYKFHVGNVTSLTRSSIWRSMENSCLNFKLWNKSRFKLYLSSEIQWFRFASEFFKIVFYDLIGHQTQLSCQLDESKNSGFYLHKWEYPGVNEIKLSFLTFFEMNFWVWMDFGDFRKSEIVNVSRDVANHMICPYGTWVFCWNADRSLPAISHQLFHLEISFCLHQLHCDPCSNPPFHQKASIEDFGLTLLVFFHYATERGDFLPAIPPN